MNIPCNKDVIYIAINTNIGDNKMNKKERTNENFDKEAHNRILDLLKGDWGKETFIQMRAYAESGYAEAQYYLGMMYDDGKGVARDPALAAGWYRKAAEQGIAAAQSNLGAMYETGDGLQTDYTLAAKWYRLAAEQGDEEAQRRLDELKYQEGFYEQHHN